MNCRRLLHPQVDVVTCGLCFWAKLLFVNILDLAFLHLTEQYGDQASLISSGVETAHSVSCLNSLQSLPDIKFCHMNHIR